MKIFLVGLPGSGKSTFGKQLAEALQLPFIDLDKEIEQACGMPVAEIFASKGEPWFREQESVTLRTIVGKDHSFVMATGGGTPCFHGSMELMNQAGTTIFLDIPLNIIEQRISEVEKSARPLFKSERSVSEKLQQLYEHRLPFYQQAVIHVNEPPLLNKVLAELLSKK
ncbi:MAG: shikimate kinase [Cyclobacteriaceae bacterium]|nr:shikimate kinase [Cyclobacteriaceae bacterium]UYN86443.1 MAG: shikimate kinase [Cyclobacteriaceae bacterium]